MAGKSDFFENMVIDGFLRGGCLTTAGAAGSSAVVKGMWTATTAYVVGDIVVPHASMTGAGGKLLRCTTAGTSGSTNTLAVPNPGATLTDASVTWTAIATVPALPTLYYGLFTANPSDVNASGTEVTGGAYARVAFSATLANFAGTQSAASTTASTGTGGVTSNNNAITFPAPSGANWGVITGMAIFDSPTGGKHWWWAPLNVNKTVNDQDAAPSFPAASFTLTED
jgi:hypothetical protein